MVVFEDKKSSNDDINNDTISDDEVVASYVPPAVLVSRRMSENWYQIYLSEVPSSEKFRVLRSFEKFLVKVEGGLRPYQAAETGPSLTYISRNKIHLRICSPTMSLNVLFDGIVCRS